MTLLLLARDDRGLQERGRVRILLRLLKLLGWDDILRRHGHRTIVAAVGVGGLGPQAHFRALLSAAKVIRLIGRRFEPALVEAEVVVFFAGISALGVWDAAADLIRVAELVERLVMAGLEVVVDHATLLLLPEREVVAFQLCLENAVILSCGLRIFVVLQHELVLGLGDRFFALLRADLHACCLHLRFDFEPVCSLSALLGLSVDG